MHLDGAAPTCLWSIKSGKPVVYVHWTPAKGVVLELADGGVFSDATLESMPFEKRDHLHTVLANLFKP